MTGDDLADRPLGQPKSGRFLQGDIEQQGIRRAVRCEVVVQGKACLGDQAAELCGERQVGNASRAQGRKLRIDDLLSQDEGTLVGFRVRELEIGDPCLDLVAEAPVKLLPTEMHRVGHSSRAIVKG